MKTISLNIRRLEGSVKRKYLRDMIPKEEVGLICLQESKCSRFRRESCFYLWGSNEVDWVENDVVNIARGIISM